MNHSHDIDDHYSDLCCRHKQFLQPELNQHANLVLGDRVSYRSGIWRVVSTQVLGTTDGIALLNEDTGGIEKVFGRSALKWLKKL
jgi:hypothetical protein